MSEGVGTGAGEGATGQDTGTAWVTRSEDCPEAPAQAHPLADWAAPGGLTHAEEEDLACRCHETLCPLHNAASDGYVEWRPEELFTVAARIKADAYQQGRADLAAKVECVNPTPHRHPAECVRAILAADATLTDAADGRMGG